MLIPYTWYATITVDGIRADTNYGGMMMPAMKTAKGVSVTVVEVSCPYCDGNQCVGEDGSFMVTRDTEVVTCLNCGEKSKAPRTIFNKGGRR